MNNITRFITTKTKLSHRICEYTLFNISPIIHYIADNVINTNDISKYNTDTHMILLKQYPKHLHTFSVSSIGLNYDNFVDIMKEAQRKECVCIVDAEKYLIQDTVNSYIDKTSIGQSNIPYIFKTYQLYRKDSIKHLVDDIKMYRSLQIPLNINLIRGKYFDDNQYNVIYDTKEEINNNYNCAVKILLKTSLFNPYMNVIFSTHNEESIQLFKKSKTPNVHHAVMMGNEKNLYLNDKNYKINRMVYLPYKPYETREYEYHIQSSYDNQSIHLDYIYA